MPPPENRLKLCSEWAKEASLLYLCDLLHCLNLLNIYSLLLRSKVPSFPLCCCFKLGFLLFGCSVIMDGNLFAKLSTDVLERPTLGFWAHEVHKDQVEKRWDNKNYEELPSNIVECGWAGY